MHPYNPQNCRYQNLYCLHRSQHGGCLKGCWLGLGRTKERFVHHKLAFIRKLLGSNSKCGKAVKMNDLDFLWTKLPIAIIENKTWLQQEQQNPVWNLGKSEKNASFAVLILLCFAVMFATTVSIFVGPHSWHQVFSNAKIASDIRNKNTTWSP